MGTWGVAIFSDDLAADIQGDFRELIGDGLTPSEATDRLKSEYASSLDDPNEMPVFWIALALAQWKLGRLEENTKKMALQVIDDGTDLARWDDEKSRAKRATVLAKTRTELLAALPPAKRVPRTIREANEWQRGETIGFQLLSGKWTMFRVIGHHCAIAQDWRTNGSDCYTRLFQVRVRKQAQTEHWTEVLDRAFLICVTSPHLIRSIQLDRCSTVALQDS